MKTYFSITIPHNAPINVSFNCIVRTFDFKKLSKRQLDITVRLKGSKQT